MDPRGSDSESLFYESVWSEVFPKKVLIEPNWL